MNETLKVINNRVSLRSYDKREITQEHLDIILNSAILAPTAGNQTLYSIIVIKDDKTKELLSKSCDNQPFIAKAPLLLLFVADQQKWFDYYRYNDVKGFLNEQQKEFEAPQASDFLLACQDAMIAAQNAVIAGESLGIGSCYIGDIMEHYEYHQNLFELPEWTFPVTLLCFGYYKEEHKRVHVKRFPKEYIVFEEKYKKLSKSDYEDMFKEESSRYRPDNIYNAKNYAQMFYSRKTGADFSKEMARSVRVAMAKWDGRYL